MKMTLGLATLLLLAGCAPPLTPAGEKVRLVTASQRENCKFLKLIMESQRSGPDKPNGALRNALNAAAEVGANGFYLFSTNSDWPAGASVSGEALKCE